MRSLFSLLIAVSLLPLAADAQNRRSRFRFITSPEVQPDGRVAFRIRAPQAKEISLRGQWSKEPIPLKRDEEGVWSVEVEKVPGGVWEYSYSVDGFTAIDPHNPSLKPQREPGRSILHVPSDPPAPWDWQKVAHGTVHQHAYPSQVAGKSREVSVYTPPGYERDAAKKYPLLVLQHGMGDNNRTWVEHGKAHWILDNLIAEGKAPPMIVMMIDGHPLGVEAKGSPEEWFAAAMDAFRRELLEDAMPLVESLYRVESGTEHRAIAGLSMGGGQSLTVGLTNLDRFGWVAAFSSAPPSADSTQKILADAANLNSKLRLLWIACGKDDFLRQRNEEFIGKLKEAGIQHEWQLTDGDHSWPVWRRYLTELAPKLFVQK